MVYFGASSYFFNTAGIAYHEAGALVFEITENMVSGTKWDRVGKEVPFAEELWEQPAVLEKPQ